MATKNKSQRPPTDPAAENYTSHWAKYWRVTTQTVRDWLRREGMPEPHDIEGMLRWAAIPGKKPKGFAAKVAALRGAQRGEGFVDPDWTDFIKLRPADATHDPLEEVRDYYQQKLRKANAAAEENSIRIYSDLVIKYEKAIRDNKLAADRLGIEVGQLLTRSEIERLIWAVAFWLLRSTDTHLDSLTAKLRALSPGLDGEPVRSALEGELLSARFLEPFVHAAKVQSGVGLPAWVIAKMREACGDFLEGGEKQFDELLRR